MILIHRPSYPSSVHSSQQQTHPTPSFNHHFNPFYTIIIWSTLARNSQHWAPSILQPPISPLNSPTLPHHPNHHPSNPPPTGLLQRQGLPPDLRPTGLPQAPLPRERGAQRRLDEAARAVAAALGQGLAVQGVAPRRFAWVVVPGWFLVGSWVVPGWFLVGLVVGWWLVSNFDGQ